MQNSYLRNDHENQGTVAVPTNEGLTHISIEEIMFLSVEDNRARIHLAEGKMYWFSGTLREATKMVRSKYFFCASKFHIVNLRFVRRYIKGKAGYLVLRDSTKIPVSNRQSTELIRMLTR